MVDESYQRELEQANHKNWRRNLRRQQIENEQFDDIMGVKHRQNEMAPMVLEDPQLFKANVIERNGLKIGERRVSIKDFLIWNASNLLKLSPSAKDTEPWRKFITFIGRMDPDKDLKGCPRDD